MVYLRVVGEAEGPEGVGEDEDEEEEGVSVKFKWITH